MKTFILDTNAVAYLMKGMHGLDKKLLDVLEKGNKIIINPITYYEICRGLIAANSLQKLKTFKEFCEIMKSTSEESMDYLLTTGFRSE